MAVSELTVNLSSQPIPGNFSGLTGGDMPQSRHWSLHCLPSDNLILEPLMQHSSARSPEHAEDTLPVCLKTAYQHHLALKEVAPLETVCKR